MQFLSRRLCFFLFVIMLMLISVDEIFAFSVKGEGVLKATNTNDVCVEVSHRIPNIDPIDCHRAFLDFTWRRGGGLPVICRVNEETPSKRTLFLLGDEILLESYEEENKEIVQEYKLEGLGLVWKSEIEPYSHIGKVSFSAVSEDGFQGTKMCWKVSFNTINRQRLWQSVTESSISEASENLVAYLSEPLLMTKTISIQGDYTPKALSDKWVEFVWKSGGGLPLPLPPFVFRKHSYDRIIVPPFLMEKIQEIKHTSDHTDVIYKVVNPSLVTYPVFSHLGRVRFQTLGDLGDLHNVTGSEMVWEVSVRPMNKFKTFVISFTETIVNILARNFKSHIENEGTEETVRLFLPRGTMKQKGHILQVRRDSWLGSVLYSHLRDERGVIDQTKDLLKPWRWGVDNETDGSLSWRVGEILLSD